MNIFIELIEMVVYTKNAIYSVQRILYSLFMVMSMDNYIFFYLKFE